MKSRVKHKRNSTHVLNVLSNVRIYQVNSTQKITFKEAP